MKKEHIWFTEDHSTPYCDMVVTSDGMLYLSGLISQDMETGEIISGSIEEETCRILNNLASILARHGSDMAHVVRAEVLLRDFSERDRMNEEYVRHFPPEAMPARLCYGDVSLAGTCRVEIMITAIRKEEP